MDFLKMEKRAQKRQAQGATPSLQALKRKVSVSQSSGSPELGTKSQSADTVHVQPLGASK